MVGTVTLNMRSSVRPFVVISALAAFAPIAEARSGGYGLAEVKEVEFPWRRIDGSWNLFCSEISDIIGTTNTGDRRAVLTDLFMDDGRCHRTIPLT